MAEVSTRRPGSGLFGRSSRAAKENPFDSDEETTSKNPFDDEEGYAKPARSGRTVRNKALVSGSSAPSAPPLPSDELFSYGSSKPKASYAVRHSSYDEDEAPTEEYVNQAVQDLERHAVKKSQETTSTIKNALRVANDTMGVGVETLVTLHDQGIQIERTHERAVDLDQHLSRGEKLLGSLGGVFSKTWRPKKGRKITGPMIGRADKPGKESAEDREALGLDGPIVKKKSGTIHDTSTFQGQVESERDTQDDLLDDLSSVLTNLKEVSIDMNKEIERQAPGVEHLSSDIQELNNRVRGANLRGQKLLRR
jgi:synaptosomal-associated protein 25